MTKPIARDAVYRKRAFDADIIELYVRWYITYRLSYRDLVEMMAEHGVKVARSTILRWVTRYVPEFEKRWDLAKAVGTSWRVDETYISIKAMWHYLYRAVDKLGKSVDFLLRGVREIAATQAFFRKALRATLPRVPRKVTPDGHVPSRRALWLLRREHPCWGNVKVPTNTIAGIELAHRIRRDNSLLVAVVGAVAGRGKRNGRWHSHKREVRNTIGIITTQLSRDALESVLLACPHL
jgi:transposase-like protein